MSQNDRESALPDPDGVRSSSRCASSRRRGTRASATRSARSEWSSRSSSRSSSDGASSPAGGSCSPAASIGAAIGVVGARTVKMTAMPQMVALFNGVGGGAAALVSLVEFHGVWAAPGRRRRARHLDRALRADRLDLVRRLDGRVREAAGADLGPADHVSRASSSSTPLVFAGAVALGDLAMVEASSFWVLVAMVVAARSLFGVLFVLPIGGADMPVVISLLNAFTGLAAAATGFVLHSNVLIVSGDARRRVRDAADDADGPRDEPLDRERPLRRVRQGRRGAGRGCGRRRRRIGALDDRRRRRRDARVRAARRRRARLRPRGRAGAARGPRSSPSCSRRRASTSSTRSIPSRAGCPGT